jgi:hypothetical protein
MLETKLKLVPLSHYVKSISGRTAAEMDKACQSLFSTGFEYTPEKPKDPPRRKDILSPLNGLDRSSCLKAGTMILMADGSSKPVEQIMKGDMILDKDLRPCAVIGCNYFFLGDRNFFGFADGQEFFTEVHLFVGPGMTLRTVCKDALFKENPCFEHFGQVEGMEGEFEILTTTDGVKVQAQRYSLYEDLTEYPRDTRVYFLEVDNPTGTYFANGFLCRHELPPFHLWPRTFACLQEMMMDSEIITKVTMQEFTPDSVVQSDIAQSIADRITQGFENGKLLCPDTDLINHDQEMEIDIRQNLSLILSQQSVIAFGLLLYGKCGNTLFGYLDKGKKVPNIQLLRNLVRQELQDFLQ